jgi:hypothetical protein
MIYSLPSYPSNRLETLLHLDALACAMIQQQPSSYQDYKIKWGIVPLWSIMHVGSMVMTIIQMMSIAQSHHYTLVYDPAMMTTDASISLDAKSKITTRFGHQIKIESSTTQIPEWVDELCCMIQIHDKLKSINLYTITERESIEPNHPIIRVWANLHQGLNLNTSLVEDEKILTQLALGTLTDDSLTWYGLLSTMIRYYSSQPGDHSISPVSYHNTALIDGQKNSTTGYCAAIII